MNKYVKIALDGPSGAGKSTLAKALAKEYGFVYVDTGAMYRTVGLYAAKNSIDPHDEAELSKHFDKIDIEMKWVSDENGVSSQRMFLCGEDVSDKIRTPEASMNASAVSALPAVRKFLLDMQRNIAKTCSVIMDGRDIGTVILPDADVKIFMSATPEARAQRRYKELVEKGEDVTFEKVLADMILRDKNDASRDASPCVPAEDAVLFDNTELDFDETVDAAKKIIEEKLG